MDSARQVELFHGLLRFLESSSRTTDIEKFCEVLFSTIRGAFPLASTLSLWKLDSNKTTSELLAERGHQDLNEVTRLANNPVFDAFLRSTPLRSIDTEKDRLDGSVGGLFNSARRIVVAPHRADDQAHAVLLLASSRPDFINSEVELRVVQTLADYAGREVHRSQLLEGARRSSSLLIRDQERERRAISQDIHDDVGGRLNSLRLLLSLTGPGDPSLTEDLAEATKMVDEVIDGIRDVSFRLSPRMLVDLGLVPTISSYARRYEARTGIGVEFYNEVDPDSRFRVEVELTVFRVVQEALTNVSKHSGANRVQVHLRESDTDVVVHVIDNGRGFDPESISSDRTGIGLESLRRRSELEGGAFEVSSEAGQGVRMSTVLPKKLMM